MKVKNLVIALSFITIWGCTASKRAALPVNQFKKTKAELPKTDTFLYNLLSKHPLFFDTLIKNNPLWNIQIIYTQIDRKKSNKPAFTHYYFNINSDQYYYPASTVKLPVTALALQKLRRLKVPDLNKETTFITEKGTDDETPVYNDPSSIDGRPTVAQYIKRILLVSDNDAFNRLYEFLGQEYINYSLHKMGYDSVQILHRLNISLTEEQNRTTNPVKFYDTASNIIYQQPLIRSNLLYQPKSIFLGKGYYNGEELINQPFDFSKKNRLSLVDLHSILISLIFPKAVPAKQRFKLKKKDYRFLHQYMSMLPKESRFPQYDTSYNDSYVKFLLYGAHDAVDSNIRIFNKVGDAYGFLTDAAYIVDFKNKVEFLLSATINCNSDGIFNDDKYDYETVGFPFMKHLGEVILHHELLRKRKHIPDLTEFKFQYGK